jgi:hypothetical protein
VERVLLTVDDQSMAGVGSTGKADDYLRLVGQVIHDLSFPFVTPLGSDNHYVHARS